MGIEAASGRLAAIRVAYGIRCVLRGLRILGQIAYCVSPHTGRYAIRNTQYAVRRAPHAADTQYAYAIRSTQSLSCADTQYTVRNTQRWSRTLRALQIHNTQYANWVTYPSCIADTQYTVRKSGHGFFVDRRYAIRSTQIGSRRYHCLALNTHLCL